MVTGLRRNLSAAVFVVVVGSILTARAQDTVWTRRYDSGRCDNLAAGGVDPYGNVLIAGQTYTWPGGEDPVISLVKFDPQGDTLWARTYDSAQRDVIGGAVVDREGSVVVVGGCSPPQEGIVVKYSASGETLWSRRFAYGGYTHLIGAATDDSLNIYASGYCDGGVGGDDVLLVRYSRTGELAWSKVLDFGGDYEDAGQLALAPDGSFLVGAGLTGDWESQQTDLLVVKYALDGDTVWTRRFDTKPTEWANDITVDPSGHVTLTGMAGEYRVIPDSCVTARLTADGETEWVKLYGEGREASGGGVAIDYDQNIVVCASAWDTRRPSSDIVLLNYAPNGDTCWTKRYRPDTSSTAQAILFGERPTAYIIAVAHHGDVQSCDFLLMKLRYRTGIEETELVTTRPGPFGTTIARRGRPLRLSLPRSLDPSAPNSLSISDISGRTVMHSDISHLTPDIALDLRSLPSGIYLCRLQSGSDVTTSRLLLVD